MDYVSYIRSMTGHEMIIMTAACCIIYKDENDKRKILLQKRESGKWGLSGGISELCESLEETALRELYEETGLKAKIDYLQGIYSKYTAVCANGDKLQPVVTAFVGHMTDGELYCDEKETFELGFFSADNLPEIFCEQHLDIIKDFFEGKRGVYR